MVNNHLSSCNLHRFKMFLYNKFEQKTCSFYKKNSNKLTTLYLLCSYIVQFSKKVKFKFKHLRCKKAQPSTKVALLKKMWNQNGQPRLPAFDCFEIFGLGDPTAKHCYFRCSKPPGVDGINIFDKDDLAAKHCSCNLNVMWPSYLYQNSNPINITTPWIPEITIFCCEVIMTKTFKPTKRRRPWPLIPISHLFQQGHFST